MKKVKYALIFTSLLMAGCAAYEEPQAEGDNPLDEFTTPLTIESTSLEGGVTVTRTSSDVTSGVCSLYGDGPVSINNTQMNAFQNHQYKYDATSSKWVANTGFGTLYLSHANVKICACYPAMTPAGDYDNKTAIPLTSQPYALAKDLSYATNQTVNRSSEGIKLSMKRAYARLKITLVKGETYSGVGNATKLQIKNQLSSSKLNITNGVYADKNGISTGGVTQTKQVLISKTGVLWGEYLLIPCNPINSKTVIVLTLDGVDLTVEIPYTPVAGEYKALTIKINGAAIDFNVVTHPWDYKDGGIVDAD